MPAFPVTIAKKTAVKKKSLSTKTTSTAKIATRKIEPVASASKLEVGGLTPRTVALAIRTAPPAKKAAPISATSVKTKSRAPIAGLASPKPGGGFRRAAPAASLPLPPKPPPSDEVPEDTPIKSDSVLSTVFGRPPDYNGMKDGPTDKAVFMRPSAVCVFDEQSLLVCDGKYIRRVSHASQHFDKLVAKALSPERGGMPVGALISIVLGYCPYIGTYRSLALPVHACPHVHVARAGGVVTIAGDPSAHLCLNHDGQKAQAITPDSYFGTNPSFFSSDPVTIVADPHSAPGQRYYVADSTVIWVGDAYAKSIRALAGDRLQAGYAFGVGSGARMNGIRGLLAPTSQYSLIFSDFHNNRLRMLDLKSLSVSTIAGDGHPTSCDGFGLRCSLWGPAALTFDRSPHSPPESAVYIATEERDMLSRFDLTTKSLNSIELKCSVPFKSYLHITPTCLDCLPNGRLVMGCSQVNTIFSVDPRTGRTEPLTSIKNQTGWVDDLPLDKSDFNGVRGVALNVNGDDARCLYVVESDGQRFVVLSCPLIYLSLSKPKNERKRSFSLPPFFPCFSVVQFV